jgi:crossover junction endodeoxyribonuclease RuvC
VFDLDGSVLGIDPGLSRCGYGVVRLAAGRKAEAVACGVIRTPPSDPLPERLAALGTALEELLAEVRPAAVSVERVLFQANARTAMSVGQASGLALATAARMGIAVSQYSPNEVKLAVTGDGAADKAQMQAMVARLLNLDAPPRPPDAADALALALCHLWRAPLSGAAASQAWVGGAGGYERAVAAAVARDGNR